MTHRQQEENITYQTLHNINKPSHLLFIVSFFLVILQALISNISDIRRNLENVSVVFDLKSLKVPDSHIGASPYLLGMSALQQNHLTQAIFLFNQAWFHNHLFARQRLVESNLKAGNWQEALRVLDLNYSGEREYYKQILAEHLPTLSVDEHNQWRQLVSGKLPESITYFANFLLHAQQFEEAENWAKSSPIYARSLEQQVIVGASYFYRNQLNEAAQVFARVYQQQPNASHAYWYGRTLLYMGQPDRSVHFLETATQLERGAISLWYLHDLSQAYVALSRCEDAKTVLDFAFSRQPSGEILAKLHAAQSALAACE